MKTAEVTSEQAFLEQLVSRRVRCYLNAGICLRGTLRGAAENALILDDREAGGRTQLVYKTAISTIAADDESTAKSTIRYEADPRRAQLFTRAKVRT